VQTLMEQADSEELLQVRDVSVSKLVGSRSSQVLAGRL